jgi:hypothetical protein
MYLRQPAIAQIVVSSIHKGVELTHFDLSAYVVMPNMFTSWPCQKSLPTA